MQWIFIVGNHLHSISRFSQMRFKDSIQIYQDDDELHIRYENEEYAIISNCSTDEMQKDFEEYEYQELLKKIPFDNLSWFMLKYSSIDILKKIICNADFPNDVFLYCDGVDLGLTLCTDFLKVIP